MQDVNNTLESRRTARDQDQRIASAANLGHVIRPYVQFHAGLYRQFADFCELTAHNFERSLETLANAQQPQQDQQQSGRGSQA